MILHNKIVLSEKDKTEVQKVLDSGHIAEGKKTEKLENYLQDYLKRDFSITVSSGSMGLILSLMAIDIQQHDEIIIPAYTCSALWHAIKFVGGEPILVDVEPKTYNLSPEKVKKRLNKNTKAIIFPHMFGQPGLIQYLENLEITIIEDIAQSIGGSIEENKIGTFGDITVSSFYATKMIGAGEGGAIITDNKNIAEKVKDLKNYDERENLKPRFNAKITDITAALVLSRLKRIKSLISNRQNIYKQYIDNFKELITIPRNNSYFTPNFYRCVIKKPGYSANELISEAKKENIIFKRPVYKPLNKYKQLEKPLHNTDIAWNNQVSIPIYPSLSAEEIDKIINFIVSL